ncbi:hypothetical protein FQA39_LY11995 [Lamprigera yunnana]|nr:hypothetical protein FQA39_LY11995 [Lamprigera yunnana]
MNKIYVATFFLLFVSPIYANSTGAPEDACEDMKPQHGPDPQPSSFPYRVTVSKKDVKQGENIQITISGAKEKQFKGFMVQVREKNNAVGTFLIPSEDELAQVLQCKSKNVAATHKSSDLKDSVALTWMAPTKYKGKLTVYVSVAKTGAVFWAAHPTNELYIN